MGISKNTFQIEDPFSIHDTDLITCSPSSLRKDTKMKLALCREDVNRNLLSETDFQEYFNGELQQKNIGDCWLVASINSLKLHTKYKELIQKSVKKTHDGFEIIMPLGAPPLYGKIIKVNKRDLYPQITVWATELMTLDGKEGLKALTIAYGKVSTGNDIFDVQSLNGWNEWNYFNTLVYGTQSYSSWRLTYGRDGKLWVEDSRFTNELKTALSQFGVDKMMVIWMPLDKSGQIDGISDFRTSIDTLQNTHEFVVKSIIKSWDSIQWVVLINPWDSTKPFTFSMKKLMDVALMYTLWSYDSKIFWLTHATGNDSWIRSSNIDKTASIQNLSLEQILSKFSSQLGPIDFTIDNVNSKPRWDSVLRLVQGKYFIDSYGMTDVHLWNGFSQGILNRSIQKSIQIPTKIPQYPKNEVESYLDQSQKNQLDSWDGRLNVVFLSQILAGFSQFKNGTINYTIKFWKHVLNFWKKNPFSKEFQWEKDDIFSYTLHPALLSVFVNWIRAKYMTKEKEDTAWKNPFFLDEKWALRFSAWRISDTVFNWDQPDFGEILLSHWEILGISKNDQETKNNIVNLLNKLYFD